MFNICFADRMFSSTTWYTQKRETVVDGGGLKKCESRALKLKKILKFLYFQLLLKGFCVILDNLMR